MGVIKKNSIGATIILLVGYSIGILSGLFIYPKNTEAYGFATFFYSSAYFFIPFASLGIIPVVYKFYPVYAKKNMLQQFTNFIILRLIRNFLVFILIFVLFKPIILSSLEYMNFKTEALSEHYWGILLLTILFCLIYLIIGFLNSAKKILIPLVLENLLYKIFLPVLVLACIYYVVEEKRIANYLIIFHLLLFFGLAIYHHFVGKEKLLKFSLKEIELDEHKEVTKYSRFTLLNTIALSFSFRIDILMIALLVDNESVGIYAILLVLANLIDVPKRSLGFIAAPVISELISEQKMDEIQAIYKQSSMNLLITGLFLFGSIWVCFTNLLSITTDLSKLLPFVYVFFYLSIAKLVDMTTSVNNYILMYSEKYKMNLLFLLALSAINIVLNYFLINTYGIVGAALSTLVALAIFNALKFFYLRFQFNLNPFTVQHLLVISIFIVILWPLSSFNPFSMEWLNIIIKSACFAFIYGFVILYFRFSVELNQLVFKALRFRQ